VQELRRLAESTRALAAAASPGAAIDLLSQQLAAWYPACESAIALYHEDSDNSNIVHTSGPSASLAIEQNTGEVRGASAGISGPNGSVLEGSLVILGRRHGLVAIVSAERRFTARDVDVLDIVLSATANALANLLAGTRPAAGLPGTSRSTQYPQLCVPWRPTAASVTPIGHWRV